MEFMLMNVNIIIFIIMNINTYAIEIVLMEQRY